MTREEIKYIEGETINLAMFHRAIAWAEGGSTINSLILSYEDNIDNGYIDYANANLFALEIIEARL